MSTQISKSQFKAKALEYFRQIESDGQPVVVTDHGEPHLEVRRYRPTSLEPLALLRGSLLRYDAPTQPIGDDDWEAVR